jgi:hypothetical protein
MINAITTEVSTVGLTDCFVAGSFDDGITTVNSVFTIDITTLTAPQQTILSTYITQVIKNESSVSIINTPYSSNFTINIQTDLITPSETTSESDYTLLSGATQGYIDDFHQLMIDLLP